VPEIAGWVVLGLVSAFGAALVAIFGKIGLGEVSPIPATMARAIVMASVTTLAALAAGDIKELASIDRKGWIFIGLAGLAGAGSWLAYFAALKIGQASAVSGLDRLSVVFVVVLAALFLGESLTVWKVVGAALMVAGAVLIAR
jgi:bacterial/archaeal transporter family protein